MRVAQALQLRQIGYWAKRHIGLWGEAGHNRERSPGIWTCFSNGAGAPHLVSMAIENHHLSVEVSERPKPEVSVLENCLNADLLVIDAGYERTRGGDLEERVKRSVEIFRQRQIDDRFDARPAFRRPVGQCVAN
jgi:hypothetical protein